MYLGASWGDLEPKNAILQTCFDIRTGSATKAWSLKHLWMLFVCIKLKRYLVGILQTSWSILGGSWEYIGGILGHIGASGKYAGSIFSHLGHLGEFDSERTSARFARSGVGALGVFVGLRWGLLEQCFIIYIEKF